MCWFGLEMLLLFSIIHGARQFDTVSVAEECTLFIASESVQL